MVITTVCKIQINSLLGKYKSMYPFVKKLYCTVSAEVILDSGVNFVWFDLKYSVSCILNGPNKGSKMYVAINDDSEYN